jgi:predicted RNA-binding Zn-ribbon protein involved in translation (DUF1610 family)
MSAHARIDLTAATRTEVFADDLAAPAAEATALAWVCPFCGKQRVFDGGRPLGAAHQDECDRCGCRLAASSAELSAIAKFGALPHGRRALIDMNLF